MQKTAVILAAGNGTRLAGDKSGPAPSKPLTELAGIPLVVRTLMTLEAGGFDRAVLVTGYRGEEVRAALQADPRVHMELRFAHNEQWRQSNGVSVLAARPFVEGEFHLLMSDHIFDVGILHALAAADLHPQGALLAVDRKLGSIYDMDDATKVVTGDDGRVLRIGKQLKQFDAVDTGVFRCTPALFEALLAAHARRGDCSLSDGVGTLAASGRMHTVDVKDAWWQDVDTPGSMIHGRRLLLDKARRSRRGILVPSLGRRLKELSPPPVSYTRRSQIQ